MMKDEMINDETITKTKRLLATKTKTKTKTKTIIENKALWL